MLLVGLTVIDDDTMVSSAIFDKLETWVVMEADDLAG